MYYISRVYISISMTHVAAAKISIDLVLEDTQITVPSIKFVNFSFDTSFNSLFKQIYLLLSMNKYFNSECIMKQPNHIFS
jgi:hypothetical protein